MCWAFSSLTSCYRAFLPFELFSLGSSVTPAPYRDCLLFFLKFCKIRNGPFRFKYPTLRRAPWLGSLIQDLAFLYSILFHFTTFYSKAWRRHPSCCESGGFRRRPWSATGTYRWVYSSNSRVQGSIHWFIWV